MRGGGAATHRRDRICEVGLGLGLVATEYLLSAGPWDAAYPVHCGGCGDECGAIRPLISRDGGARCRRWQLDRPASSLPKVGAHTKSGPGTPQSTHSSTMSSDPPSFVALFLAQHAPNSRSSMITHPSQEFLALVEELLFALSPSEQGELVQPIKPQLTSQPLTPSSHSCTRSSAPCWSRHCSSSTDETVS